MERGFFIFIAVTFGGSVAVGVAAALSLGPPFALAVGAMFLPALGVLAARIAGAPLGPLRWKAHPAVFALALLTLPLAVHGLALPVTALLEGGLPWSEWLHPEADGLFHAPAELGWGVLTSGGLTRRFILNAVVGIAVVTVLAFFEEVGWRAWLLPRLVKRSGERLGVAIGAALWALWHVPYIVSGLDRVDNVSTTALVLIAPFGLLGAGMFIGWLYLRWGSIAVVALAHGALNSWAQFAFKYMTTSGGNDTGLLAAVNLALLAVGLTAISRLPAAPQGVIAA